MATKYGQELILTASATGADLVYVWEWWDGTKSVTSTNVTRKVANRWGVLNYMVTAVDPLGQKSVFNSTVTVDRPPEFLSVSLTKNNELFPYVTQLNALVTGSQYPIACTFNGSNINVAAGTQSVIFDASVNAQTTQWLVATDSQGVVARLPIFLFGAANRPPVATPPTPIPPVWRTNSRGTLVTMASDPEGGALNFLWKLTGAEGWSPPLGTFPGTSTIIGNGTQNLLVVNTVSQVGNRNVILEVTDNRGAMVSFVAAVTIEANANPSIQLVSASPSSGVYVGGCITFTGTATDPTNDYYRYQWTLSGPIVGGVQVQNSRTAIVSASGAGNIVSSLTVADPYLGSATMVGPTVTVDALPSPYTVFPYV